MREVKIFSGNETLMGTIFDAPEGGLAPKPAALLIHGWQSAQDRMFDTAEILSQRSGITCLTVDLKGHGKSEGKIGEHSRKDFLNDVIAAYDFLVAQPNIDTSKIGVLGSSFGGYLAPLLSSKRKVVWMVLRVPADYPDEGFETPKVPSTGDERPGVNDWRGQKRNWDATAALRAVHDFHGKILIVESENDDLVPHQAVQNYMDAVTEKRDLRYELMKGAPHSLTKYPEFKKQFNEIVFEWEKSKSKFAYTTILG